MKAALILLFFVVCVAVSVDANCWFTDDECKEDECCVRLTNFIGKCKKLKGEGENCGKHDMKQPFKDHVHLIQCPCEDGLKCVEKEGLIGKIIGTCEAGDTTEGGDE